MYATETKIRVRYSETDRMGYCYYGNYAQYFEVARVESLRSLGVSYKSLEDEGILLPVSDFNIKYLQPAFYDDELVVKCIVKDFPGIRLQFHYETYRNDILLNKAETTLVFVDKKTGRPTKKIEHILKKFTPFFNYK